MGRRTKRKKTTRTYHLEAFRSETLALAVKIVIKVAAEPLGPLSSRLYGWRSKVQLLQACGEMDQELGTVNARLNRALTKKEQRPIVLGEASMDSTSHCNSVARF